MLDVREAVVMIKASGFRLQEKSAVRNLQFILHPSSFILHFLNSEFLS